MASDTAAALALMGDLADVISGYSKPTSLEVQQSSQIYKDMVLDRSLDRSIAKLEAESSSKGLKTMTPDELIEREDVIKENMSTADTKYAQSVHEAAFEEVKLERNWRNAKVSTMESLDKTSDKLAKAYKASANVDDETVKMLTSADIDEYEQNVLNAIDMGYISSQSEINVFSKEIENYKNMDEAREKLSIYDTDRKNDFFDMPGIGKQRGMSFDSGTKEKILRALNYLRVGDGANANKAMDAAMGRSDEIDKEQRIVTQNYIQGIDNGYRKTVKNDIGTLGLLAKNPEGVDYRSLDNEIDTAVADLLTVGADKANFSDADFQKKLDTGFINILDLVKTKDKGFVSGDVLEQTQQRQLNNEGKALYLGGKISLIGGQWVLANGRQTPYTNTDGSVIPGHAPGQFGKIVWDPVQVNNNKRELAKLYTDEFKKNPNKVALIAKVSDMWFEHRSGYKQRLMMHGKMTPQEDVKGEVSRMSFRKGQDVAEQLEKGYDKQGLKVDKAGLYEQLDSYAEHLASIKDEGEKKKTMQYIVSEIFGPARSKGMINDNQAKEILNELILRVEAATGRKVK